MVDQAAKGVGMSGVTETAGTAETTGTAETAGTQSQRSQSSQQSQKTPWMCGDAGGSENEDCYESHFVDRTVQGYGWVSAAA